MKNRTRNATRIGAVIAVAVTVWVLGCVGRLTVACASFRSSLRDAPQAFGYPADETQQFFKHSRLLRWRSLRPLLRRPWRADVRLNWQRRPPINRHGPDAHAIRRSDGAWQLKIHW